MKRDHLDAAIDHVAARLVAPQGDDHERASRIVASLPERSSRLRWLLPQFAAISAIAIAAFLWTMSSDRRDAELLSSSGEQPMIALTRSIPERTPQVASATRTNLGTERTQASERLEPLEPVEPLEPLDHERSLPGIPALQPLQVTPIEISSIGVDNK